MAVLRFDCWFGRADLLGADPENYTSLFSRLPKAQRDGNSGYLVAGLLYAVGDSEYAVVQ